MLTPSMGIRERVTSNRRARRLLWVLLVGLGLLAGPELAYRGYRLVTTRYLAGDSNRFDLYLIGGSACAGWPWSRAIPREALEQLFEGRFGDRELVIHLIATAGDSIYPQRVAFERAVRFRDPEVPAAVIVYSGHNDRIDPLRDPGPTVAPTTAEPRSGLLEHSLLWEDLSLFLRRRLPDGAPDYTLANFEAHLQRIIASAREAGVEPILATVASNISACDPNFTDLSEVDTELFAALLVGAGEREATGDPAGAIALYREQLERWPTLEAGLHYRIAKQLRALGDLDGAREHYWRALDRSPVASPRRATREQNAVLLRLAEAHDLEVIDVVAAFEAASPQRLPGGELFLDGVHPNPAGVLLLAEQFALGLSRRFGVPVSGELTVEELRRQEGANLARGYLSGASWYLSILVVGHIFDEPGARPLRPLLRSVGWFSDTFDQADRAYLRALELSPEDFSPHLGRAVVELGRRSDLFMKSSEVDRLVAWRIFDGWGLWVPADELPGLLEEMEAAGVDPTLGEALERVHARGRPEEPEFL